MKYVEIYADVEGISHFRDVDVELNQNEVAAIGLSAFRSATDVGFVSMPPKWVGDWHQPPAQGYVFVMSGEVQIEVGDGEIRRFAQGSVWLHKDRNGRGHYTSVVSDVDAKLAMVMFPDDE